MATSTAIELSKISGKAEGALGDCTFFMTPFTLRPARIFLSRCWVMRLDAVLT
jgi:hypothetical protein